jgi:hypothetical protein
MDASRYFYQQLSGRFFRIALLSFFIFISITALLVLRDNQITLLAGQDLPSLTKENEQQKHILTTYLALDNLANRTNADNLANDYKQAQQQINEISLRINNNKSKLDLLYVGHKEFSGVIDKLDKNHDRNNQLKQNTIIQLQLINDQLTVDIKKKLQQKDLLLQQITSDKFTDKVTATRAKAYARQVTELSHLQQLQQTIIRALLAFQQLDLQYSILDFDDVSAEIKQVLAIFLPERSTVRKSTSLLSTQLITLEQLLFLQQNSVAKWRSHLRLSRLYVEFIKQQQQKLQQLVLESSSARSPALEKKLFLIDWIPTELNNFLAEQNITLSNQHVQITILGFITLLFLLLLVMIFRTKKKIQNYGQESVLLFTDFIESMAKDSDEKLSPELLNSTENINIAEQVQKALENIINPEHSEKEYQQQLEEQQVANNSLNKQIEEIQKLKTCIEQLEQSSQEEHLQRQLQDKVNNEKLCNMVVRTMLQSQSVSIGSGVSTVQVYRQLSRIFDWSRQNELLSVAQSMTLNDVALHNEIDAALLNIITDAHFQRNKIYYQQDEHLLTHAKLDIRLFHRLLNGICRLLLADLFKANLKINSSVIDINEGQQFVRFDFSVTTSKTIVKIPEEIERLLLVERPISVKITSNDTLDYLCLLFDSLNVSDKNVQLQESGFQFSFTLPIAFADVIQGEATNKVDLQQANILLLSDDKNICFTLRKAITSANGLMESCAKPELVTQQLNTKSLMEKKVDIVILGSDLYAKSLESIQQHIMCLSKKIQPKFFVMQPYFTAHLERHGLFKQAANPLKISEVQQSISEFLVTDKMNNIELNASTFTEHQYLMTQVEVLFAIDNPTKHLPLLRILQWLGLQVKIVCQPKELLEFWGSGRYLILFTEFEQSPFIEMAAGKGVRRDIFTFKKSSFTAEGYQELIDKWGVSEVPALHNIDALVALLQPWLKAKKTEVVATDKPNEQNDKVQKNENVHLQTLKTNEKLDQILSTFDSTTTSETTLLEPFQLEKYAQNQGSAELAMVMLDDYIADINEAVKKLSDALDEQNYQLGISLINSLIKTSTILAAQDFLDACQQLLFDLNQGDKAEQQRIIVLFGNLCDQKQLLNQFAEAI